MLTFPNSNDYKDKRGVDCVVCVIFFRGIYQFIEYQEQGNITRGLNKFCDLIPEKSKLNAVCKLIVAIEGPLLIQMLENYETPDVICQQLRLCTNPQCRLYGDKPPKRMYRNIADSDDPWWKKVLEELFRPYIDVFDKHLPLYDYDADGFTSIFGFRGTGWRGKDCNNWNKYVYPGRKFNNKTDNPNEDNNCNGIFGVDRQTGLAYEDLFCSGTLQRGVAVLGDSASAHFRLPPQLFTGPTMTKETYSHLFQILELEVDWPHMSWATGYANDTTGLNAGLTSSIYKKLKQRNRCIHRDFQNISVNGARTGAMIHISKTLSRNQTTDHPILVFYSLIGNDVCSGHKDFNHMTAPEEFYKNVVQTLDYLETILPMNSYVFMVGLAKGSVLYDTMLNATHPMGVSYPQIYDYLNCLEISPCWGWMNTNATVRQLTDERAALLSKVYSKIIADRQQYYKHFKIIYHDFPIDEIWRYKGPKTDLIEPIDGFHPSQLANSLLADYLYEWLEQNHPDALGPINPYNNEIDRLFGDQGGY